jgi:hypothetical protein
MRNNNKAQIKQLVSEYYLLVNRDHHKDRDCHFYISKVVDYRYGGVTNTSWQAEHCGYCNPEFDEWFATEAEAEAFLIDKLKEYITNEKAT